MGNSYPVDFLPNSIQKFEHDLINVVVLISLQDVTFLDCMFTENNGTPIYAYDSRINLCGNVTFQQNSAVNGGGFFLSGDSLMLLLHNTHVYILNNSALFNGGGIFIPGKNIGASLVCFFQIDYHNLSSIGVEVPDYFPGGSKTSVVISDALNITVTLEGNTARQAGSAIYGGKVDHCDVISTSLDLHYSNSSLLFDDIFQW